MPNVAVGLPHAVYRELSRAERIDAGALALSLKASFTQEMIAMSDARQRDLDGEDETIATLQEEMARQSSERAELGQVGRELHTQAPLILRILYGPSAEWRDDASAGDAQAAIVFTVSTAKPPPRAERPRLERWLSVRLPSMHVVLTSAS